MLLLRLQCMFEVKENPKNRRIGTAFYGTFTDGSSLTLFSVDHATGGAVFTCKWYRGTPQILSPTVVFHCSAAVISSDPHGVNTTDKLLP